MSFSYDPLWNMLSELNISKMDFAKMVDLSNATLAKLGKNEPITLSTLDKICNLFNCDIEYVVKHVRDIQTPISAIPIEIGMIALTEDVSQIASVPDRRLKRPYVILAEATFKDDENIQLYAVAPIYTSTNVSSPLKIPFEGVEIDGRIRNGIVAFNGLILKDAGSFEKVLGRMPEKYMNKLNKILQLFDEASNTSD